MISVNSIFLAYGIVGLLFIIFNKKIAELNYKLVLFYTNKLNVKDFFIFKIDHNNRDSMFFLTRSFTIFFGIGIFAFSLYHYLF